MSTEQRHTASDTPHVHNIDQAEPAAQQPNVVYIVLDDIGFADLGCYGSEIATPNIDKLADGGVRYTNFHTTAMCSPTRACLLTGREHHSVGMGIIAEWSTPHAGYTGRVTRRAANLAEVLGEEGYSTLAVGKWHLMPQSQASPSGPYDEWPLRRGFDRWYGFHGALADQWNPELFEDNHTVETPHEAGYHLSEDLVDRSISYLRDQHVNSPNRPFFLYLAFGAAHWPHHVPAEYSNKYRGRYDKGWDEIRTERLQRQKDLGVVPDGTDLTPRNPGVKAWDELDSDRRRLFARMQEIYAGFIEHTDAQIGRLIEYLERLGQAENTLIVLLSDNGSSPEGGPDGAANGRKELVYEKEDISEKIHAIDELGGQRAYNHYPWGWAQASNTPLKWYKKDVHGGGVRDPLVVHWPQIISEPGTVRQQYHHVVDIMPTVLELLGVTAPETHQGVDQMPMHGTSLAYSLVDAHAPTRKRAQYYELLGDRAMWRDGWKAVARHEKGTPFEDDVWELYHLDDDFSESHDLAEDQLERLARLIDDWWSEAHEHNVLPLDDREYERVAESIASRARASTILLPGMSRLDRYHVPDITDRSYTITADIETPHQPTQGVLLSIGSRFGGCVLYLRDRHLTFEYAYDATTRWCLRSTDPLPDDSQRLTLNFTRTGPRSGTANLKIDERPQGSIDIPKTWPVAGLAGGLHCGRDGASPVSDAYSLPFTFDGIIHQVRIDLHDAGLVDIGAETRRALADD